jgi:diguanylate cyclase (GGDEF)-like protein/PAS domain S-box-containing protein
VVLSGIEGEQTALDALKFGAEDYLVKNQFSSQEFFKAITFAVERFKSRHELQAANQRYQLAIQAAHEGLMDWDLVSRHANFSELWLELLGIEGGSMVLTLENWADFIFPEDKKEFMSKLAEYIGAAGKGLFSQECRMLHQEGSARWFRFRGAALRNHKGEALRFSGSIADINDRKAYEAKILYESMHDPLTRIPNRAYFLRQVKIACSNLRRSQNGFAILYLDLDRLKFVNDKFGHECGDKMLVEYARRIEGIMRQEDTFARLGGDEFALLLNGVKGDTDAQRVAHRLRELFSGPVNFGDHEIVGGASIGIRMGEVLSNNLDSDVAELLRDADGSMYQAKISAGEKIKFFHKSLTPENSQSIGLEVTLRSSLKRGDLSVHFQPIASFSSEKTVTLESLVRWNHLELGSVSPMRFIPLCESNGMIHEVGFYVLEKACEEFRAMNLPSTVSLAVNFSVLQFSRENLPDLVLDVLKKYSILPQQFVVEVTESISMSTVPLGINLLGRMKKAGIGISLDDFGTGYSSISTLDTFPLDYIKVDRSIVDYSTRGHARGLAIIRGILSLGKSLNLKMVAEGVEQANQHETLKELGFDCYQGFYLQRPGTATELLHSIDQGSLTV